MSWTNAFKSLKKATEVVEYGNEIWMAAGTYQEGQEIIVPEDVTVYGGFLGTETDFSERDIENNQVIIDGQNLHRCFTNNGTIDGLYVTKGNASGAFGGGIYNSGVVKDCRVYLNQAYNGGGIYGTNSVIDACVIYENSADNGGGIYIDGGTISFCKLFSNTSNYYAGGICNHNGVVQSCIVYSNTARYGGGIDNYYATSQNCIVYKNHANDRGGGIWSGEIINCTIYGNTSVNDGPGIYGENPDSCSVKNTISWGHTGEDITTEGTVSYSCFGSASNDNGNINSDPLFENVSGDSSSWNFRLQSTSPCIDTGTDSGAPDSDIEGALRPMGNGVDMGAYEFEGNSQNQPP